MSTEGLRIQKILSFRDGIALIVAVGLGIGFAYLSALAGFAWLIVAGPYTFLVIPCVVIFLADQRKFLVWQVSVLSSAIYVRAKLRGIWKMDTLKMMFAFWALGTICSGLPLLIFISAASRDGPATLQPSRLQRLQSCCGY
jgi:hypothetical protein